MSDRAAPDAPNDRALPKREAGPKGDWPAGAASTIRYAVRSSTSLKTRQDSTSHQKAGRSLTRETRHGGVITSDVDRGELTGAERRGEGASTVGTELRRFRDRDET